MWSLGVCIVVQRVAVISMVKMWVPHGSVVIAVICVIWEAHMYRVFRAFVWNGLQSEFFKFAAFETRLMSSPPLDSLEPSVRFMLFWVSVGWRMWIAAQCHW